MVDSGLALNVGAPAEPDHLLALGTRDSAMTIEASSAIGPILEVLGTGQFPGVEIGVGPLPGVAEGGGVPVGETALWISARSSPERRAAAWELVKFLDAPEQQAALHVEGGSVPIRISVTEDPAVRKLWQEQPAFRVGYDQLLAGEPGPATAGSVIGDYQGVRDAVRDAVTAMLAGRMTPEDALQQAQREADEAIRSYNERVGA
jgi:sn-glycerol 3-phosphate transport system substrate-binding protein